METAECCKKSTRLRCVKIFLFVLFIKKTPLPCQGYVEMTGVDSDTSQDIAEAISLKGGRYLEAQMQGSKTQAQDGTLVILVAGDRSLFDDCQSCFQVAKKNLFIIFENKIRK